MADVFNAVEIDPSDSDKLLKHLEKIKEVQASSSELAEAVGAAMEEFRKFFLNYGQPYFTAHTLDLNATPESALYNENIETLVEDLERLYKMVSSAAGSSLTSYNFAAMVANEVKNSAELSASKVLDLSILSDFVKGTTIVAGDDFINADKIDSDYPVETTTAELINGASSIGLKTVDVQIVSGPGTKISVTPVLPAGPDGSVNTDPTPQNLERFYEGKYYAPVGQQNPEGGKLDIKYIVDPSALPGIITETSENGGESSFQATADGLSEDLTDISDDTAQDILDGNIGFFAITPATEEQKSAIRGRMTDGNPDTWWECEFVFESEPLIDPFNLVDDDIVDDLIGQDDPNSSEEIDG